MRRWTTATRYPAGSTPAGFAGRRDSWAPARTVRSRRFHSPRLRRPRTPGARRGRTRTRTRASASASALRGRAFRRFGGGGRGRRCGGGARRFGRGRCGVADASASVEDPSASVEDDVAVAVEVAAEIADVPFARAFSAASARPTSPVEPCGARNRSAPAGTSSMPRCAACSSTVSPAATSEFSMLSAAFSRCSAASCSSARPMPAFSFSSPSCIVTIPISANATNAIHARPRISRSSSAVAR